VEEVNARQKKLLAAKTVKLLGDLSQEKPLAGKTIACWGLSFKPRTDDMRKAPSVTIVNELLEMGAAVRAHDPEALKEARKFFGERITYSSNQYEILEGSDALVIITDWSEYRNLDFDRMMASLKVPLVIDDRNLYRPVKMKDARFRYVPLGRNGRDSTGG
jgi:UDPglucose 6-dehydrogenase